MWLKGRAFALNQLMNQITDLHIRFSRIFFSSLIGRHFCLYTRKTISDFFFLFFIRELVISYLVFRARYAFAKLYNIYVKRERDTFSNAFECSSLFTLPFSFHHGSGISVTLLQRQITTKEKESKLNFCVCFFFHS